jgi:undecaprenyl phosphate N,N'-diacetylbacillosamine 1-phosphate transferase
MIYKEFIKPFFDRLAALLIIAVLSPLWIFLYFLLYLTQGSEVFYSQVRSGRNLKRFILYKIRTLQPSTSTDLSMTGRSYTFLGRWLRTTGIDELPQLLNILKGEMSFVGPRALPVEYEEFYNDKQKGRFECLPGITGWAQIHGRNSISWSRRFGYDLWYAEHIGFCLDCKIMMRTLFMTLQSASEERFMPVFTGTNKL